MTARAKSRSSAMDFFPARCYLPPPLTPEQHRIKGPRPPFLCGGDCDVHSCLLRRRAAYFYCARLFRGRARWRAGVQPRRRELSRLAAPVVDSRLFVTPQHRAHLRRDLGRTRPWPPQQLGEDPPHLRPRHRRIFFSPTTAARSARTTGPARSASCDVASPVQLRTS